MSNENGHGPAGVSLAEAKAAAEDLLLRAASPEIAESFLFPNGITQIAVSVQAGDVRIQLQIAGPDHGHSDGEDEDEDWLEEDPDDLFEDEDDER